MYIPAHFAESEIEPLLGLMQAHPLATLVATVDGRMIANHVPLMHVPAADGAGVLRGHVARANPVWQEIGTGAPALAIFQDADAYVSPALYPSKASTGKVVPTWNYSVVHVHGRLRAIDDVQWLEQLVTQLTNLHESRRVDPWAVSDAPAAYIDALLRAIVGIELTVEHMEGKFKLSQNRPQSDRAGIVSGLAGSQEPGAAAVAARMAALPATD